MQKFTLDRSIHRNALPLLTRNPLVGWPASREPDEQQTESATGTKLLFRARSGRPIESVKVSIRDMAGKQVLDTRTSGLCLVTRLPDGQYRVRAELDDGAARCGIISVCDLAREYLFSFRDH